MSVELEVQGTIMPAIDLTPTHKTIYGEGGIHTGSLLDDLEGIHANYLTTGTLGYAIDSSVMYIYDGSDWNLWTIVNDNIGVGAILGDNIGAHEILSGHLSVEVTDSIVSMNDMQDELILYATVDELTGGYQGSIIQIPPTSSSAEGEKGEWALSNDYLYICTATDIWKRITLTSTWP